MSWLLGVILAAGMAHGQPPPATVTLTVPPSPAACAPTEFSVTVDNRGGPARDVPLVFEFTDPVGVATQVQVREPSGQWRQVPDDRIPGVSLPAGDVGEYRLRAAFPGGRHTMRVRIPDLDAVASATVDAAGPEIRVLRPVPDRITDADSLEFGVAMRGRDGLPRVPLALRVRTDPSPGRSSLVDLSVPPWPWWRVDGGRADLDALPSGQERRVDVRVRPDVPHNLPTPVEVQLVDDQCVAASDTFLVVVTAAPPVPARSGGLMFGLGVGIGAVGMLGVLRARRRVRP